MAEDTIREKTFCCGAGAGLGNDENMEMRMRGGMPRAMAVREVVKKHGVNRLGCICAIDRATLTAPHGLLGAGRDGHGRSRTSGQCSGHEGRKRKNDGSARRCD